MGLGSFKYVSLAYARAARDKARAKIIAGVPIEVRGFHSPQSAPVMTFDECSSAYIKAHSTAWRNARHRAQWTSTLAAYASPVFGALPVDNIDTHLVMRVLEPLWNSRPETARRCSPGVPQRSRVRSAAEADRSRRTRSGNLCGLFFLE